LHRGRLDFPVGGGDFVGPDLELDFELPDVLAGNRYAFAPALEPGEGR
jgi:hypothetical protein